MKRLLTVLLAILSLLALSSSAGLGQPLTLDECIEMAYENLEYEQQSQAYRQSSDLAVKNAGKSWFPKITLDGSFSHQNENVSIPVDLQVPGLDAPAAPLNFSRLLLNFNQTIYDGSVAANSKKLKRSQYTILEKQMQVEKIEVKSRVISLFMSVQLTDEKLNILVNRRTVISGQNTALVKAAGFGGATVVNIKTLDAELLMIDQNIIELQYTRGILVTSLSQTIGRELPATQQLLRPDPQVIFNENVDSRPEIQLLDSKIANLEFQKSMVASTRRPKLSAFATIGAGSPGYDIFNEDIAAMGMIGARLQWHILDWSLARNERQILTANQSIVRNNRFRARMRLVTELKKHKQEIELMHALLAKDDELIALRAEVSVIKVAELENGTITSTDYVSDLNLEEEARLNQKVHELRLILAKLNYLTLQGN